MEDEYSCHNRKNLLLALQVQLPKRVKNFHPVFITFYESTFLSIPPPLPPKRKELHSLSRQEYSCHNRENVLQIYCKHIKCNYLKKPKKTRSIFLHFSNLL